MKLYIIGNGGHAKVISEAAGLLGFEVRYIVQNPVNDREISEDLIFDASSFLAADDAYLICGVGSVGPTSKRQNALNRYVRYAHKFVSIVHPSAYISPSAQLGKGVFVAMGALIGTCAKVAEHAIVNSGSIIDHDSSLLTGTHLAPGSVLSGGVSVGEWVHIGCGARIIQGITIADQVVIGAGATVIKNIEQPSTTWVGTPARKLGDKV